MKVEFMDSERTGAGLYVSAVEFMKAKHDQHEMASLEIAVDAFYTLFGVKNPFNTNFFDGLCSNIQKTSTVSFLVYEPNRLDRCARVFIEDGNKDTMVYDGLYNKIY